LIRLIFLTSPLHDIGKVGIPDAVLRKPGRLNAAEFEIMKTHTTLGAETLDAALARFPEARFLHVARNIAAAHHERWDGSGYPLGIAGEQIPLCARVVALADVYDALTTRRCYKEAYSHLVARSIIETDSGKHFDPRVVAAFLAAEEEFLAIQRRFSDRHESPPLPLTGWSSTAGVQTRVAVTAG
jgi:putative two-component system response regulator